MTAFKKTNYKEVKERENTTSCGAWVIHVRKSDPILVRFDTLINFVIVRRSLQ